MVVGLTANERQKRYHERRVAEIALMPEIPCECGCGTMIPPISKKLKPARFAHGHNDGGEATRFSPGQKAWNEGLPGLSRERSPRWRGGEWRIKGGYVRCTITAEQAAQWPTAIRHGGGFSIPRSHVSWNTAHPEDVVKRGEHVHHLNGVRDDDRPENLRPMDALEHESMHGRTARRNRDSLGRFAA